MARSPGGAAARPAEQGGYRRLALVLDDEFGRVGELALRLVRARINALYANDLDEAVLLAHQERGRVGAVVVPVGRVVEWLPVIEKRLQLPPSAVIPVGERPGEETLGALRGQGLRWGLWGDGDERAMRFVVTSAMSETDDTELRLDLRVPTRIEGRIVRGVADAPCTVCNLSEGGALLSAQRPLPVGERVSLELLLDRTPHALASEVRWVLEHDGPDGPAWWMGVQFEDAAAVGRTSFREFVREACRSHRL